MAWIRLRNVLRIALALLPLLGGLVADSRAADAKRPNILFAFADDWGRLASVYAAVDGPGGLNDVVRTPNFDRIAKRGVLFRNAFVNAPSCTPCRSSILSGQYFWRTGRGAILRGAVWDDTIPAGRCCCKTPAITSARPGRSGAPACRPMRLTAARSTPIKSPADDSISSRKTRRRWSPPANRSTKRRPNCSPKSEETSRSSWRTASRRRRLLTGSGPPTCIASGSRARAKRCGASIRISSKGSCRRFCPTCPRCARTWPTTSARSRPSTRRSACWSKSSRRRGSWTTR